MLFGSPFDSGYLLVGQMSAARFKPAWLNPGMNGYLLELVIVSRGVRKCTNYGREKCTTSEGRSS